MKPKIALELQCHETRGLKNRERWGRGGRVSPRAAPEKVCSRRWPQSPLLAAFGPRAVAEQVEGLAVAVERAQVVRELRHLVTMDLLTGFDDQEFSLVVPVWLGFPLADDE